MNKKIKIIDSLNFLKGSLQKLVENHIKAGLPLKYTTNVLINDNILQNSELYNLLVKGKGVMCYDYLSDLSVLKETKLPEKKHFYNHLYDKDISEEEYNIALKVFDLCKCKSLSDYLLIYNRMDVLLLADIFLTWRDCFFYVYKLDIVQYLTISAFSFDAFLLKESPELKNRFFI